MHERACETHFNITVEITACFYGENLPSSTIKNVLELAIRFVSWTRDVNTSSELSLDL